VEKAFGGHLNCKGVPMTATAPDQARNARIQQAIARLPPNRTHGDLVNAAVLVSSVDFSAN
jgi:hypothetical protein